MSDIPTELFRKILLQLPAESLFRLRSVCKTWLRIIDDPCFIKSHTNNQLYNDTLLVRNETGAPLFSFSLDSLKFVQDLQEIDAIRIKQLIRHGVPRLPALFHLASCNGLILISHEDIKKIWAIWNPLTGESRELPQLTNASLNLEGFGFGYDYEADDYKVVRIDRLISDGKFVYQTLVYSLKSDSWSMIEDCVGYTPMPYPGVFLNGTLYWRSWEMIVALDIRTGSYSQLPLPSVYIMDMNIGCHLDALDGCLIFSLNYYNTNLFDGWVMKDNGAEKSWIKLFSLRIFVSPFESQRNFKLVAYLKGKEQVVLQYSRGFVWFDIANNSVLNFSVHCFSRIASSRICPGSLVRLKARGSAVGFETGAKTSTKKRKRNCKKKDASLKICVRGNGDDCCFSDRFCREDLCDCSIEKMRYWDREFPEITRSITAHDLSGPQLIYPRLLSENSYI